VRKLFFALLLFLPSVTSAGDEIQAILDQYGKEVVAATIRDINHGNITLDVNGQRMVFFGAPNEKYVTPETIREDLEAVNCSIPAFRQLVERKFAQYQGLRQQLMKHAEQAKLAAEQPAASQTITENPAKEPTTEPVAKQPPQEEPKKKRFILPKNTAKQPSGPVVQILPEPYDGSRHGKDVVVAIVLAVLTALVIFARRAARAAYISRHLLEDEKTIYSTSLHWILFFWPAVFLLVPLINPYMGAVPMLSWLSLLCFVAVAPKTVLVFLTSEFGITNYRVVFKVGFIRRRMIEILLAKVETITIDQPLLGRLLGYGTLVVLGTGGSKVTFPRIRAPLEFRQHIYEQLSHPAT
jgi:uncharacterized membrane protein YdbT with pleckstrin-like domain